MSDPLPTFAVGPRIMTPVRPAPVTDAPPAVPAVRTRSIAPMATSAAVALAVIIRTFLVLSRDFPLNDGALFYLMTKELSSHGFHLPAATAYNGAGIPFAYSPLGFYLAAFLHSVGGFALTDLLRALPLVFSSLCVVAFYLLARELTTSRATLVAALCTFAVLPRSFLWLIMGGGLTRSIGFMFAILTLWQVHQVYTRRAWRNVVWATILASLTVLSHLGTAPFVAFSAILFLLFFGRHRFGVYASVVIALGTIILTAPWWASVAAAHGFAPFAAAGATGGTVFNATSRGQALTKLAFFGLGTAEPLFPVIGALAIIGAFASLTRRGSFLPIWWLTIILLDTRGGATYASIPVALLASIALIDVIVPVVARAPGWSRPAAPLPASSGWDAFAIASRGRRWTVIAVLTLLLGYGVASSILRRPSLNSEGRFLTSLTSDDRAAMSWVSRRTAPTNRFLIVVGGAAGGWWSDRIAEWFPVLANRVSVATVQGTEWLPHGVFAARERAYDELQGCAIWGTPCIEQWARDHRLPYTHVYLPKTFAVPCCGPLDAALRHDTTYAVVFDGPAATIFARRPLIPRWKGVENW